MPVLRQLSTTVSQVPPIYRDTGDAEFSFSQSRAEMIGAPTNLIKPTIHMQQDTEVDQNSRYACLGMNLPWRTFPINHHVLKLEPWVRKLKSKTILDLFSTGSY